jgi:hypothetical protein
MINQKIIKKIINKYLIINLLLFLIASSLYCEDKKENIPGLTKEVYDNLCGVWTINLNWDKATKMFSWGKAEYQVNSSVIFELGDKNPYLLTDGGGKLIFIKIVELQKKEYELDLKDYSNKEALIKVYANDDGTISFEDKFGYVSTPGRDKKYYKLSGPNKTEKTIKFVPTIDNLRFRESPTLDGKFIKMLVKGEKLDFMEKGKEEIVNGVKGTWVKVKTEKGEVGWAFDAYLEEVK